MVNVGSGCNHYYVWIDGKTSFCVTTRNAHACVLPKGFCQLPQFGREKCDMNCEMVFRILDDFDNYARGFFPNSLPTRYVRSTFIRSPRGREKHAKLIVGTKFFKDDTCKLCVRPKCWICVTLLLCEDYLLYSPVDEKPWIARI